tara:strand:- start:398 stop:703 length:306 start_codon:yes stop_codon:yes gene_type:complete
MEQGGHLMSEVNKYLNEAISNIREDREKAKEFLSSLETLISTEGNSHKYLGSVAAKYLETLQRSNEQLVKVVALIQKKQVGNDKLSDDDKNEIFEMIKGAA